MKKAKIILAIIIPVVLLLFSFRIFIYNSDFYKSEFEKLGVYSVVPEADFVSTNIIHYFKYGTDLNPDFFTEKEILHLQDVRSLIWKATYLLILFFFLFVGLLLFLLIEKDLKSIGDSLLIGGVVTFGLTFIVILLAASFFPSLFTKFHLFFFSNDLWLLPNSTVLIKILPLNFFYDITRKILMNSLYLSSFLIFLGLGSKYSAKGI